MSVKSAPFSEAQLIHPLPNDTSISSFEYLDPKTLVLTKRVCKAWRDNSALNDGVRKDAFVHLRQRVNLRAAHEELTERRQYPQEMVRLFRSRNMPISTLPVLDFGDRMGGTGYIDMLRTQDMAAPIMRFTDKFGRPGIAFHVEGHADGPIRVQMPWEDDAAPARWIAIPDISGVLAVFKRYTDGSLWKIGMGGQLNYSMSKLHNDRHNENGHIGHRIMECPNCPKGMSSGDDVSYMTLATLLDAQDPLFRIAQGYTPVARRSLQAPEREEEKKMVDLKKR